MGEGEVTAMFSYTIRAKSVRLEKLPKSNVPISRTTSFSCHIYYNYDNLCLGAVCKPQNPQGTPLGKTGLGVQLGGVCATASTH